MNNIEISLLFIAIGYSFLLMHLMDNGMGIKWQLLFLIPVVIAISIFLFFNFDFSSRNMDIGFLSTPIIVVILYNLFNLISWHFNNREFRLHIRGARNMGKTGSYGEERIYHWTDTVFSLLLIMTTMLWSSILVVLLNNI